jgi:flavin-dependent thymidylate synthase
MKVTLFDFTGAGYQNAARHAADCLIFTKSTRLNMAPDLFYEISKKPEEEILQELKIMANTNPGSWEFVHFSFIVEGVTRGFTHQLVRTRQASYAQQTMRVLKMQKWTYGTGPTIKGNTDRETIYDYVMRTIDTGYNELIEQGAAIEDARGILPTNIMTNICMSINMRNFINLTRKRVSIRVQNEYRQVMDHMVMEIEKVYPWFYIFYKNDEIKARKDLQNLIYDSKLSPEEKTEMIKKLDIIGGIEL